MARYTGPKTKIARRFGEAIFGADKSLDKKNYGPGQHGNSRRRSKQSEYSVQLLEKQKAKYTTEFLKSSSVIYTKKHLLNQVLQVKYFYNYVNVD